MVSQAASLEDGDFDDRPKFLGGKRNVVEQELTVLSDSRVLESVDPFRQSDFRHHKSGTDLLHFLGGLDLAFGKKVAFPGFHFDIQSAQRSGQPQREIPRDKDLLDSPFSENCADDASRVGSLAPKELQLPNVRAAPNDATVRGVLCARPISGSFNTR